MANRLTDPETELELQRLRRENLVLMLNLEAMVEQANTLAELYCDLLETVAGDTQSPQLAEVRAIKAALKAGKH